MDRQTIEKGKILIEQIDYAEFQIEALKKERDSIKDIEFPNTFEQKRHNLRKKYLDDTIDLCLELIQSLTSELKNLKVEPEQTNAISTNCTEPNNCCNSQSTDLKEFIDSSLNKFEGCEAK